MTIIYKISLAYRNIYDLWHAEAMKDWGCEVHQRIKKIVCEMPAQSRQQKPMTSNDKQKQRRTDWMIEWLDGWINEWMNEWTNDWMNA